MIGKVAGLPFPINRYFTLGKEKGKKAIRNLSTLFPPNVFELSVSTHWQGLAVMSGFRNVLGKFNLYHC